MAAGGGADLFDRTEQHMAPWTELHCRDGYFPSLFWRNLSSTACNMALCLIAVVFVVCRSRAEVPIVCVPPSRTKRNTVIAAWVHHSCSL
ncbi:hypothetical protein CYLTODRAFT_162504 [Cylindrobasidium torrendii FP15055 ss-10]|uniref:Uncharacterized protein n=1 Tax=Cylindrobasidium torrendii FP15055 ss-10 TaxID=1314674 RepID=A0A0D7AY70_9AGAR|nr:hypothetical protein CYLTODRAFT_162504 [Cylindrobasidium torrendii FP15055 ss-10]